MLIDILVFAAGLVLGSFLNVCIHRLPRGESILSPGSSCPKCKQPVAWFDNIPLLSFLLLRGRCRRCDGGISVRYPLVELASGGIWYGSWKGTGGSPLFWITVTYLSLLLVLALADLETGLIPDAVTFAGIGFGLAASFLYPALQQSALGWKGVLASVLGLGVGGGLIFLTGLLGNWIFQRESMGGGDARLLAMIGSFLGWEKVLLAFFIAPLFALPFALYRRLATKEEVVPYAPFLSLAGAVQFFYGDKLWSYFLRI